MIQVANGFLMVYWPMDLTLMIFPWRILALIMVLEENLQRRKEPFPPKFATATQRDNEPVLTTQPDVFHFHASLIQVRKLPKPVSMSKKCMPLWREAHFQVNMYKTPGVRTTFGSSDVEKVHAVVARSTF